MIFVIYLSIGTFHEFEYICIIESVFKFGSGSIDQVIVS